ncbi:hypothetical protein HJB53_29805 [Rhizobium lentis]|uniref:hypothetical protein n=1 Tax=Rhizobium lentis TaxID=1138194 RepID=UPI001C82D787|nr:hypothetical protein [Rhizobium lentis]MBX5130685.1 hypothetical protein [Rhizobium lentis]
MAFYLTLSRENQFQFTCPVFNATTKMAACMMLREAVWMGKRVEKRQGCQAAMSCGMCPAAAIVSKMSYSRGPVSDDYGSKEPKVGKLHADILDRLKNVIPIQRELGRFTLSDQERQMLLTTRGRFEDQLKSAPGRDGKATAFIEPKKHATLVNEPGQRPAAPTRSPQDNTINRAAMAGDMSAAINAAA